MLADLIQSAVLMIHAEAVVRKGKPAVVVVKVQLVLHAEVLEDVPMIARVSVAIKGGAYEEVFKKDYSRDSLSYACLWNLCL